LACVYDGDDDDDGDEYTNLCLCLSASCSFYSYTPHFPSPSPSFTIPLLSSSFQLDLYTLPIILSFSIHIEYMHIIDLKEAYQHCLSSRPGSVPPQLDIDSGLLIIFKTHSFICKCCDVPYLSYCCLLFCFWDDTDEYTNLSFSASCCFLFLHSHFPPLSPSLWIYLYKIHASYAQL
jgi:hypothetical protein